MITMINTIQENEIFNLADKVDYQDGASHPLVIDSNDRGEHVLIFQALEGEAVLHVGGKDLNVKKGDFLYLKEGTLHHLQAVTRFKFSMVRIYK